MEKKKILLEDGRYLIYFSFAKPKEAVHSAACLTSPQPASEVRGASSAATTCRGKCCGGGK